MKKQKLKFGIILIICAMFFLGMYYFRDNNIVKIDNSLAENYAEDLKYGIILDMSSGSEKGFNTSGFEKIREGVYGANVKGASIQVYSAPEGVHFSQRNGRYLMFWSLDPNCTTRDLEIYEKFDTSKHTVYYACYEESVLYTDETRTTVDNEKIRYVLENAYVSGETVYQGDAIHVTDCYIKYNNSARAYGVAYEYCDFDQVKHTDSNIFEKAYGTVYRNLLTYQPRDNYTSRYTVYFHQASVINGEEITGYGLECANTQTEKAGVCKIEGNGGEKVSTPDTSNLTHNGRKFIGWAADDDGVDVNCSGKLVTGNSIKLSANVNYYACYENTKNACQNSEKITGATGKNRVTVCYNSVKQNDDYIETPISDDYTELFSCASGYTLDNVSTTNIVNNTCNSEGVCYKTYELNCKSQNRPQITSITNGKVRSDGFGTITFSGNSEVGIKGYYASSYYEQPTINSNWIFDARGTYSVESEPGTIFLWTIDNNDSISYAAMGSVIDTINSDTTVKNLEIRNANGDLLNTELFADANAANEITSENYVRLNNALNKNSEILADGFNPFDTAYKLTTDSKTITVYATLTSNDSKFVVGYEPRTVVLDYGINTILLKIQDKNGKIRTYTIIVTRKDDRDSSNLLKNITVSEGKIDFDPYKTDYTISVGKNKKTVSINGELANTKASFVDGYGPRKVKLTENSTTVALKVQSERGSIRAYTLTFVKNGKETTSSKNALLSSLSLSKAYISFDKNTFEYNTTVENEVDAIDIYALAENGGDSVTLYRYKNGEKETISNTNILLETGYNNIKIEVVNEEGKKNIYSLNILRKENGLNISSDTQLSMLSVDGYNINFEPNKYDYEVKIKTEKTLVIAATPQNNTSEVYIRGNDNLTAFSTVRIKVVAENGQAKEYTLDIKKDQYNKKIEMIGLLSGVFVIICGIIIIAIKKRRKSINDYYAK